MGRGQRFPSDSCRVGAGGGVCRLTWSLWHQLWEPVWKCRSVRSTAGDRGPLPVRGQRE